MKIWSGSTRSGLDPAAKLPKHMPGRQPRSIHRQRGQVKPTHRRRILLVKWAFLLVIFLPLIQDQAHEQFVSFPGSSPASFRQAASQATATSPPDSTNPTPTPTLIP